MGTLLRLTFRMLRLAAAVYGAWVALRGSRLVTLARLVLELVRGRGVRDVRRAAQLRVVTAGEPAIYRRRGWRRLGSRTP